MTTIKFGAADLVKRSAAQILYFIMKNTQPKPTVGMYKGNEYADKIVQKEEASSEKRGIFQQDDYVIFFTIDMVKDNKYVEIKMVNDMNDYPDWYLQLSIVQATLYATLVNKVKILDTPKFRRKEGYAQEVIEVIKPNVFELWFGDDKYNVYANDKVLKHYMKKAKVITKAINNGYDFDSCKLFDSQYKFKEFSILNPKYKKIG